MRRRIVAIVNPASGRRRATTALRRIDRRVREAGAVFDVLTTEHPGHATALAAEQGRAADAVLAVGGDGTACEVVHGLVTSDVPFALLPAGTENLLARELGMWVDHVTTSEMLLHGRRVPFDVGSVNDQHFLSMVGVGFDAECVERMARIRTGHISRAAYFLPIWKTFWTHRFPEMTIDVDGQRVFDGRGLAIIGNIARYALGLRITRDAHPNDGLLDLCVCRCKGRLDLVGHACRAVARRHIGHAGVVYRQAQEVTVQCGDDVPIQADGDAVGTGSIRCRILPSASSYLSLHDGA